MHRCDLAEYPTRAQHKAIPRQPTLLRAQSPAQTEALPTESEQEFPPDSYVGSRPIIAVVVPMTSNVVRAQSGDQSVRPDFQK